MIDRNTNTPLNLDDIAELLSRACIPKDDTLDRVAKYIKTDPRLKPTLDQLRQLLRDAYPEEAEELFHLSSATDCLKDLETLLTTDEWQHPREVLEPGDPDHCIPYETMIRILTVWAQRAEDPEPFLRVKEKLVTADAILEVLENTLQGLDAQTRRGVFGEMDERWLELRNRHLPKD